MTKGVNFLKYFLFVSLVVVFSMDAICAMGNTSRLQVSQVLQSHMVIQQDKPLKLWGTTYPGANVQLVSDWMDIPVRAHVDVDGDWVGEIPVPKAIPGNFDRHTLHIITDQDTTTFTDVLIGEVWLCTGQSNMQMPMQPEPPVLEGVIDYEKEIAAANYPYIRYINILQNISKTKVEDIKGEWRVVSPSTAGELSGVAYHFGRELFQKLQVPVGLVVSAFGGSAAQAWTSRQVLSSDSLLKARYLDPYDNSPQAKESLDSIQGLEKLLEVLARPSLLYNAMIFPLTNLSIRGFLWYQGESNKMEGDIYDRLNAAMIEGWRRDFNQGELPFYYVQMTPYNWFENDPKASYYARLREAQEDVLDMVENTGMVVTMDIGEVDNIHPRNKKDVGLRLAKVALNQTYGFDDILYLGPTFVRFEVEGRKVKVSFDPESIGTGLTTSDGEAPQHFYLAGRDKKFHKAEARIEEDQVWLQSDKVPRPMAVRYAFTNYPITNLQNEEGLPAVPFRTDDWAN